MTDEKPVNLGERLRTLRGLKNVSMRSLARESGLSANALSMIERGLTSPSVSTLYKLSDGLNVPVTSFFSTDEERQNVVYLRAKRGPQVPFSHGTWEGRGGEKFVGRVEPFVLTLDTGAESGQTPMVHTGHEFVFCFAGSIEYEVEQQTYLLNPGDSLLFAAHLHHRWRNVARSASNMLIIISGYSESDQPMHQHLANEGKVKTTLRPAKR